MSATVNLINFSIQKYDCQRHLNVENRLIVPIEKDSRDDLAALKLISIALICGLNQSFHLDQSCQIKHKSLSFLLNNPIFCLPSIGFVNEVCEGKTLKKLDRIFKVFQILPLCEKSRTRLENTCYIDSDLISFVADNISNRIHLDMFVEENDLAVTLNEEKYASGKIENGRLLSTIADWEHKLAS